jgi:predicted ArsR family transcriptional regulator
VAEGAVREKVLKVLHAVRPGVRYSTSDWGRILGEDRREIRRVLNEMESGGEVVVERDEGRPDKPLYKLKEAGET